MDRYVIELQGFTDKIGSPTYNETLSEARCKRWRVIWRTSIWFRCAAFRCWARAMRGRWRTTKLAKGRKMNRRVEVKLWVPESQSKTVASSTGGQ